MVSSVVLLALATAAAALKVTQPSDSSVWAVGEDETVKWDTVSSDQSSFNIYLSNMATYPSTTILLASDVSSDAGSVKIDGSKLTAGTDFTINFTNGTETEQIYAQSNQFNITKADTTSSSSSTATATSSDASSSTGTAVTTGTASSSTASATDDSSSSSGTAEATSSGTSSGSAASATSSSTTSGAGKIMAGWVGVIAVAVMAL